MTCAWLPLQPFLAPFVLSALGCTGGEDRLVECPLALRPDYPDEDHEYSSPEECMSIGPLDGPSFAAVACGFGTEAGAAMLPRSNRYHHIHLSHDRHLCQS